MGMLRDSLLPYMVYMFFGIAWLLVFVVNGCIALIEWCINYRRQNQIEASETEVNSPINAIIAPDNANTEATPPVEK